MIHFLFLCFFTQHTLEMNGDESCCSLKRQEISTLRHDWVCFSTVCTSVTYSNKKNPQKPMKWRTDSKTCLYRSPPSVPSSLQRVQGSFRVFAAAAAAQLSAVRQVNHGAVTLEHESESWCKFTRKQTFSRADFCDLVFLYSCLVWCFFILTHTFYSSLHSPLVCLPLYWPLCFIVHSM